MQVWEGRAPAHLFSHTSVWLLSLGSGKQRCNTFLICSYGMESHGPGQEDHDGYCPYVEIGSCDLARREKDFSQRMKCGARWKQTPTWLQPSTWRGSCCRFQQFNLSPTPVLNPPNSSGVEEVICAPKQASHPGWGVLLTALHSSPFSWVSWGAHSCPCLWRHNCHYGYIIICEQLPV